MSTVITADNKTVRIGDRVFNYYDGKWGTIVGPISNDGWFDHKADDGKFTSLNGERICQTIPKASHWYAEYSE